MNKKLDKPSFLDATRGFLYNGIDTLSKKLISKSYLFLSFLVPAVIVSIVFIFLGIYPYGNNSILTLDMNGQYVYFFEQFRDILTGQASFFYTFERSLGGEFLGNYTYYLASPLSIIVAFFPANMITEAIAIMMIIKAGLAGFTFSIYLDRTRKKNIPAFVMFSTMYALCSYATIFQSNTMWMDALIWLPLITLGIESVIKENKFKLYIISLFMAIWSNYYIGYMICIFVVLYFFFYLFAHKSTEINFLNEKNHGLKSFGRIALYSIIAVLMAGAIIVSAYYSLQFGKSDLQQNSFAPDLRFNLLDLISKSFIGSFDTIRGEGTPNIYAGTLALILVPVFFATKKATLREKIAYGVLCAIFVLSFSINTLDLIWHGFQMPIWLNYRYSFIFSFILLCMAYRGYEAIGECSGKLIGGIGATILFALLIVCQEVTLVKYTGGDKQDAGPSIEMIVGTIIAVVLLTTFIILFIKLKAKQTFTLLIALTVCIEAYASTMINWTYEVQDAGWASRYSYRYFIDESSTVSNAIQIFDPTFYRIEKGFQRKPNDNLALDIKGITEFTSTFNKGARDFLQNLGFQADAQTTTYLTGNELSESLLGVKYIMQNTKVEEDGSSTNTVSKLYIPVELSKTFSVHYNPYALPIAYSVDEAIKKVAIQRTTNTHLEYAENILSAMLGADGDVHDSCNYTVTLDGCYKTKDEEVDPNNAEIEKSGVSYRKLSDRQSASFTFNITAQRDGEIYMFLPTLYNTPATCHVNGELLCTLFQSDTYKVHNIGEYKEGDEIKVKLTFEAKRIFLLDSEDYFIQYSPDKLKSKTDELKAGGLDVKNYSDTLIEGTIKNTDKNTVFTTIPYDACWQVYVDGQRVDTFKCIESMIAFDLPENENADHTYSITMKYVPLQWIIGSVISLIGIGGFVVLCVLERKRKKKVVLEITDGESK